MRGKRTKSKRQIAPQAWPETELLEHLPHFRVAATEEHPARASILGAGLQNGQQNSISQCGRAIPITLSDNNLVGRFINDDVADTCSSGQDAKQTVTNKGQRQVIAPVQIFDRRRKPETKGRAVRK